MGLAQKQCLLFKTEDDLDKLFVQEMTFIYFYYLMCHLLVVFQAQDYLNVLLTLICVRALQVLARRCCRCS